MKDNSIKQNKNNYNIIMIPIKSIPDVESNQKLIKFNGFNIIELNENDENNKVVKEYLNKELENDLDFLSEKEKMKLKKIAQKCENFFSDEKEINIKDEPCFKCRRYFYNTKDLLYFQNRKDLLNYLKYCFYYLKKIIFINHQNYTNNKYDLEKCNNNYLINWKFFIAKAMCKICFMEVINMDNLFGNLKTIFCDIDKIDFLKQKNKRTSFHLRRGNYRYKMKRRLSKIKNISTNSDSNKKGINNKINNENITVNYETNCIIIKKSIFKDIDFNWLEMKNDNENQESTKNISENKLNNSSNSLSDNIINDYQINQTQILTEHNLIPNYNVIKEEKTFPQFISNKIYIYIYLFMRFIISKTKNINDHFIYLNYIENKNITLEDLNKFKQYLNETTIIIKNNEKRAYKLFMMIHKNFHWKMFYYINKLLCDETRKEVQNILRKFLHELNQMNIERATLINRYFDLIVNLDSHFNFLKRETEKVINNYKFLSINK